MQILTSNLLQLAKAGRTISSSFPRAAVLFFWGSTCYSPHFLFFSKLKIVGTASFLRFSRRGLNVEPREVLIARFCWKQSAVKWSAQMRECFVGSKDSLFIFISHSFLSFGSSGNLKVLTLDLESFLQLIAAQKTMLFCSKPAKLIPSHASTNNFEFPALLLLVNSDVTSSIVRQPSDNFAERFTIIKDQKVQFLTSNISARLCSITLKLQRMSI